MNYSFVTGIFHSCSCASERWAHKKTLMVLPPYCCRTVRSLASHPKEPEMQAGPAAARVQAEFTISSTNRAYAQRSRECFLLYQKTREAADKRWRAEHPDDPENDEVTCHSVDELPMILRASAPTPQCLIDTQHLDTSEWIEPNVGTGHEAFVYLSVCRALGVIHGVEGLDFKTRTFYDITGSGGLAPIAAAMLFQWNHVKLLECREVLLERARNMVVTCRLNFHDLHKTNVLYHLGDPLTWDFVEGDVVFIDATQLGFDEVALVHALRSKLEDLVAGSFIVICTHVDDPFRVGGSSDVDCPFKKIDCGPSYSSTLEPCERHVLVYKTVKRSKDVRTEIILQPAAARRKVHDSDEDEERIRVPAAAASLPSVRGATAAGPQQEERPMSSRATWAK